MARRYRAAVRLYHADNDVFWGKALRVATAVAGYAFITLTLIGNGLTRFFITSSGTRPFRPDASYHRAADIIAAHTNPANPNPAGLLDAIQNTKVSPMQTPEIIAGGCAGTASMTIIASTIFSKKPKPNTPLAPPSWPHPSAHNLWQEALAGVEQGFKYEPVPTVAHHVSGHGLQKRCF